MSEYLSTDPFAGQDSSNEYLSTDPMAGETEPVRKKERSIAEYLRDGAISVNKGIGNTVALAGTLGGLVTGDMDNAVRRTGERYAKRVSEKFSDVRKQQLADNEAEAKRIEAEDGDLAAFWHGVKTGVTDPLTVAEQLPNLALGGGVGAGVKAGAAKVVGAQAAQRTATSAAVGTGVALEGADPANQFYDEAMKLPDAQFQQNPDYQAEFKRNGGDHDAAKKAVALDIARRVALSSGAVSYLASKIPGARKLEEAITGGKSGAAGRLMNAGVGAGGELAQGAVEGGFGQFAGNVGKSEINPDQSLRDGVASNAGLEAGVGGVMGAGGGFVSGGAVSAAPAMVADVPVDQLDVQPVQRASPSSQAAPEPTDAERALTEHKPLTALDRVDEINAEDARLSSRLAELSAPDSGYGEMFDPERADLSAQRQALEVERGAITASWPQAVAGSDTTFSTEAGVRLGARYALMEADDLQSSHDTNLRPNPVYPPDLQPRERDRAASGVQIASITQKIDPARLGESADAATGAPIVGADGLVESGNARTIALKRVYQANGQKAAEYRSFIQGQAERFGLTPEAVAGMKNPVLVRVRTTPVNRAEFARQANASTVAAMSPSEQARADAARIEDVDGLTPDENGDFMTGSSRDFVRRFVARLPGTEQAAMIDAAGNLSQSGYARVRNAVLAKAYGDSPVLLRMVESLDDNMRNMSKALMQAAPVVAKSRQAIGEGALFDADITPDLMAAVEELSRLKDAGVSVHDALAQAGMFGETYSPETRELMQFLADNLRRPRKISEFITTYFQALNAAGNPAQGSLLGEAVAPGKGDLLNAARRTQDESINPVTGPTLSPGEEAGTEYRGQPGDAARDQARTESDGASKERVAANEELKAAWDHLAEVTRPKTGTLNFGFDPVPAAVALVRLFKAAFKAGTLNARAAAKYVRAHLNKDPQYKHLKGTVDDAMLASAARVALDEFEREGTQSLQGDLFAAVPAGAQGGLFDSLPEAKPARPSPKNQTWGDRSKGNYKLLPLDQVIPAEVAARVESMVTKWRGNLPKAKISDADRVKAESMLVDVIAAAQKDEPWFDDRLKAVASEAGIGYLLGPTKGIDRAAVKLVDENFDVQAMKDIVRGTIVVNRYEDAQAVLDSIAKRFKIRQVNNKTPDTVSIKPMDGVEIKDRLYPEKYRDVTAFVYLPGGGTAEIQINIPGMLSAKDAGHVLYEGSRVVENDPARQDEYTELRDGQIDLYEAAYSGKLLKPQNDSSVMEPIIPRTGTDLRGLSSSVRSSTSNTSPSGNSIQASPSPSAKSRVPGGNLRSGNLSSTFIGSTSTPSIAEGSDSASNTGATGSQKEPEVLRKARAFATKFHKGQKRKFTGEDYISHPAGLVRLLRGVPHTDEMLAAAWLHDTVEDTRATFGDVRAQFGVPVMELVKALTKVGVKDKAATLEQLRNASAEAQTVKLADIIHNTANVREVGGLFADDYLAEKSGVLDVLTKGDATLMKVARGIINGDKTAYDEYINGLERGNEHGKPGAGSIEAQSAGAVPAIDGERESGSVRARPRGANQSGSDDAGDADSQKQRLRRDDEDRSDEGGGTRLSTGGGKGMDLDKLTAVRDRIAAKMENLPPVHVFASPNDDGVPLRLRNYILKQGAMKTVEGAMHDGAIYLFASGLKDEARAEFVLAEHEVTHYGLRGVLGNDLTRTMQQIWNTNPRIRRAAAGMKGLSNAGAVEEVLADMTAAELTGLRGWRVLVGRMRDWLQAHGFTATADWLTTMLEGSASQQAQADAYAADLVRRARAMVAGDPGKQYVTRNLADDSAAQEAWLTREAKARGYADIDELAEKAYPVFEKLAAKWRERHPADVMLSRGEKTITSYERRIDDLFDGKPTNRVGAVALDRSDVLDMLGLGNKPVRVAEHKVVASGTNHGLTAEHWKKIPEWLDSPAAVFDSDTQPGRLLFVSPEQVNGNPVVMIVEPDVNQDGLSIHLLVNAYDKTGGRMPVRRWVNDGLTRYIDKAKSRSLLESSGLQLPGVLQSRSQGANGSKRKIYTDVDLVKYRAANAATRLSTGSAMRGGMMNPESKTIKELEARHGKEISELFGIEPAALTANEAQYLLGFRTTDELRNRVAKAGQERLNRLRAKGVLPESQDSSGEVADTKLSAGSNGQQSIPGTVVPQVQQITKQPPLGLPPGVSGNQASWDAPENTGFDNLIYKIQNKNIDLKRVIEAVRKSGKALADMWNPYLQEELFHGRAAKRTLNFVERELNPLLRKAQFHGLTLDEIDGYLHARHAEEANKLIAQRDPGMPDGGSGMTTADARAYLNGLSPSKRSGLADVAAKVDAIIAATRQLYAEYGLESQDTIDEWGAMFKHYVPLMREDMDGGGMGGLGQGFSIKGKEVKHRTGSTRAVVDILANIAMQREKVVVRGEKNRVAMSLAGLAKMNPNPDFWTFDKVPTERVLNEKTGLVETRVDPMFKSRANVIVAKVRVGGGKVEERAVVFNERNERAMRMALALKNMDVAQLEGLMGISAKITRYFSSINTQYNPVFGFVNLTRDVQGALLNLNTTALKDHKEEILRQTFSALSGIYRDARAERKGGAAKSKWAVLWDEFTTEGGQTGYRDLFATSEDRANKIKLTLDPSAWMESNWGKVFTAGGVLKVPLATAQKLATPLFDWLSDFNLTMENAVRLSAYKVALERGMSKQQAASLAKNLTVNFNRKGQAGQQAGALYAFFNAAMQGTARIAETVTTMEPGQIKTLRLSRVGKTIVGGGVLLGVMQAVLLAAMGFDDDEPPEFVRERNIIIPIGGKDYITIPMPLGYHAIPNVGRVLAEIAMDGGKDAGKRVFGLFGTVAESFNPLGGTLSLQTISPTAIDPFVALGTNEDWTGRPIAREDFSSLEPSPGFTRAKDTASGISKALAEAINYATGGTDYTPGVYSPTPDEIDYLWGQVTGGVGREINKATQTIGALYSGEDLPTHKIPLLGRYYGSSDGASGQSAKFYENLKESSQHYAEIRGRLADGLSADEYMDENPGSQQLAMAGKAFNKRVGALRKVKRRLIEEGAPRADVKEIETLISETMADFNLMVEESED